MSFYVCQHSVLLLYNIYISLCLSVFRWNEHLANSNLGQHLSRVAGSLTPYATISYSPSKGCLITEGLHLLLHFRREVSLPIRISIYLSSLKPISKLGVMYIIIIVKYLHMYIYKDYFFFFPNEILKWNPYLWYISIGILESKDLILYIEPNRHFISKNRRKRRKD